MKILWVNPSFLDYRIPLYEELNSFNKGDFYLIYSKQRVPQRCVDKIEHVLGGNAIGLNFEKTISIGRKSDFANTGILLPFPKGLYKLIKSANADVIIAEGFFQFTPWALFYSIINRIPIFIAYERTAHTERNCPWVRKLYRKLVALFVDGYIVNGSLTKEYLISQGIPANVIFPGAMCADSDYLSNMCKKMGQTEIDRLKNNLRVGDRDIIYLYVGRLIELKGIQYLLDAWLEHIQIYSNDQLLIIGNGSLFEKFTFQYGKIDTISFLGEIDYSQIYKYYAISDVFVIPTLEDNWSLVVPEAMSCKLAIASSIYNGCYPELVHEKINGKLFDPLERKSIKEALSFFHSVNLESYGKSSAEIVQKYNPRQTAENILEAINLTILK